LDVGRVAVDAVGCKSGAVGGSPAVVPGKFAGSAVVTGGKSIRFEVGGAVVSGGPVTLSFWSQGQPGGAGTGTLAGLGSLSLARTTPYGEQHLALNGALFGANPLNAGGVNTEDGLWHHFALVHDGANTTKLYVDAVLAHSASGSWNLESGLLDIGKTPGRAFDNIRLDGRALTQPQLAALLGGPLVLGNSFEKIISSVSGRCLGFLPNDSLTLFDCADPNTVNSATWSVEEIFKGSFRLRANTGPYSYKCLSFYPLKVADFTAGCAELIGLKRGDGFTDIRPGGAFTEDIRSVNGSDIAVDKCLAEQPNGTIGLSDCYSHRQGAWDLSRPTSIGDGDRPLPSAAIGKIFMLVDPSVVGTPMERVLGRLLTRAALWQRRDTA
jgi:hypothetical protein